MHLATFVLHSIRHKCVCASVMYIVEWHEDYITLRFIVVSTKWMIEFSILLRDTNLFTRKPIQSIISLMNSNASNLFVFLLFKSVLFFSVKFNMFLLLLIYSKSSFCMHPKARKISSYSSSLTVKKNPVTVSLCAHRNSILLKWIKSKKSLYTCRVSVYLLHFYYDHNLKF